MPEVSLEDEDAFNTYFASVAGGELPGFVMRQVCTDTTDVRGGGTVELVREHVDSKVEIGEEVRTMMFKGLRPNSDWQFHIDTNDAEPTDTQVSIYWVTQGTVLSALIPLLPHHRARVQRGERRARPEFSKRDQKGFQRRQVRRSVLVPEEHLALLSRGDVLVFTDALHVHKFETITIPRHSVANLLYVRLPQDTDTL